MTRDRLVRRGPRAKTAEMEAGDRLGRRGTQVLLVSTGLMEARVRMERTERTVRMGTEGRPVLQARRVRRVLWGCPVCLVPSALLAYLDFQACKVQREPMEPTETRDLEAPPASPAPWGPEDTWGNGET